MTDEDRFHGTIDLEDMDPRIQKWVHAEENKTVVQRIIQETVDIMTGFEAVWGNTDSWPVVQEMMAQAETTERKMLVLTALNRKLESARKVGEPGCGNNGAREEKTTGDE